MTSCRAQEQVIHEIQPAMLQIFHTPSSLFSFSIRSICFHKSWQGWKMVSAITSAKKIWRIMVSQPLHIWDLWWFYRFIDRTWLELWGHPFSDSSTQFQGFLRWYEWALEPLATLFLLASNGCSASLRVPTSGRPSRRDLVSNRSDADMMAEMIRNNPGWNTWRITCWWYTMVYLPLWKFWVRQLGLWTSQYMESHKICSKPPTR